MLKYLFLKQPFRSLRYILLMATISVLDVGLAYVMAKCIELATDTQLTKAALFGLIFMFYVLIYVVLDYFYRHQKLRLLQHAQISLRNDLLSSIYSKTIRDFHEKNSSQWVSVLVNDLEIIEECYYQTLLNVIPELLTFLISFVCLCLLSPVMTGFVTIIAILQTIIPKIMAHRLGKAKLSLSENLSAFTLAASEHLQGFDLIKSVNLVSRSLQALQSANNSLENQKFHSRLLSSVATLLSFGLGQIVCVGIYFFGALMVATDNMSLGEMIAAAQLSVYIATPLETLSSDIAEIIGAKEVINTLHNLKSDCSAEIDRELPMQPYSNISVKDISFSYDKTQIFENASITFERGKKYLLRGASGVGKSTLAAIVTGALSPDKGGVYISGQNISKIDLNEYAKIISICSQNSFVFNDTLRNNITLFSTDYTDRQIEAALHKVGFGYLLNRFEHGLDEPILQFGQNLSGGERQRIVLARMELLQTPYIILDESFANFDYSTIRDLSKIITSDPNRTVILIAHQLPKDVESMFDVIVEIKEGKIYEEPVKH